MSKANDLPRSKKNMANETVVRPVQSRMKADLRRERIINAAVQLFSENSYEATRIEEIAELAGCTTGPVYHFFQGKEEIFIAAYSEVARRFSVKFFEKMSLDKDPLSKIVDICHCFYELPIGQAAEFSRSGLRVLGYQEVLKRQEVARTAIKDLLHEAMLAGDVPHSAPEPLSHLIFGMAIEALALVGIDPDPLGAETRYMDAVEALVWGLRTR